MTCSPASPFLALPAELRVHIYRYAFDWPNLHNVFTKAEKELDGHGARFQPSQMRTPSILLINRQVYFEAQEIPYEKALILKTPPPISLQMGRVLDITNFISRDTLQRLRYVVFQMDLNFGHVSLYRNAKCWLQLVEKMLDIWGEKNCLERVDVMASYDPPTKIRGWTFDEAQHHRCVMELLSQVSLSYFPARLS
jgi:hypothetical protein